MTPARGTIRTQWRPVPGWSAAPGRLEPAPAPLVARAARVQVPDAAGPIVRVLARKLEQGHWRVACRRYLLVLASGGHVPAEFSERCEQLLRRCSPGELQRMRADAESLATLLR